MIPDTYKPDLTCKITIRCSKETKRRVLDLCRREDWAESDVVRFCLEAGIFLAEREGMTEVLHTRREHMEASGKIREKPGKSGKSR
jgi:hypothetical protein